VALPQAWVIRKNGQHNLWHFLCFTLQGPKGSAWAGGKAARLQAFICEEERMPALEAGPTCRKVSIFKEQRGHVTYQ